MSSGSDGVLTDHRMPIHILRRNPTTFANLIDDRVQSAEDITGLLRKWSQGDGTAGENLTRLVYADLRRMAKSYLRRERPDHSLKSVELVHEAYLRLVGQDRTRWQDR